MRVLRGAAFALVILAVGTTCGTNVLLDPDEQAVSLPGEVDVALGASHDVLVIGCQDKVTITDFVFPVAATALFVGVGRLDAAFYLPGALVKAAIPECDDIEFTVRDAKLQGDAFELEPTGNDKAYKTHTKKEGEVTFTAKAEIGDSTLDVKSTLRAWKADRVELTVQCDRYGPEEEVLAGYVPAGRGASFKHQLYAGTRKLSGYGFYGVTSPGLTFVEQGIHTSIRITDQRGPFTVTSDIDPNFSLNLTAYDATDFDSLTLKRLTSETMFVGMKTKVRPLATIGGKVPCVSNFMRTITISTPNVCRFTNPDGPTHLDSRNYATDLEALAPGNCVMELTLPGSALTSSLTIPVFRGFDPVAALPAGATQSPLSFHDFFIENPNDMHLVGLKIELTGTVQSATLRRSGGNWGATQLYARPRQLQTVDGVPGTQAIYAVGRQGGASRWTGSAWAVFDAGTADDLNDVWVEGTDSAYVVGNRGTFAHVNGSDWNELDAGTARDLRSVWGDRASGDVYLAGLYGTVLRYDGATFTDVLPASMHDGGFHATGIIGSRPTDLWVYGGKVALHYDGSSWMKTPYAADAGHTYARIWPTGDGHAYMLARHGTGSSSPSATIDRFDGTKFVSLPVPSTARALMGVGNDIYVLTGTEVLRYTHNPADVFP